MDNFERFSDVVRRRLETRSSAFQTWSECGQLLIQKQSFECICGLVRTRSASRLNLFGFSFEHVSAFRSNTFHTTIERVQAVERTRSYVERTRLDKNALYLVPGGYCI